MSQISFSSMQSVFEVTNGIVRRLHLTRLDEIEDLQHCAQETNHAVRFLVAARRSQTSADVGVRIRTDFYEWSEEHGDVKSLEDEIKREWWRFRFEQYTRMWQFRLTALHPETYWSSTDALTDVDLVDFCCSAGALKKPKERAIGTQRWVNVYRRYKGQQRRLLFYYFCPVNNSTSMRKRIRGEVVGYPVPPGKVEGKLSVPELAELIWDYLEGRLDLIREASAVSVKKQKTL
jgi:hypothetical protein